MTTYPYGWYQFCVTMREHYERRGEPVAGLVYHAMRLWIAPGEDSPPHVNPVTDEGFKEVGEYVEYKLRTLPWKYGLPLSYYKSLNKKSRKKRRV